VNDQAGGKTTQAFQLEVAFEAPASTNAAPSDAPSADPAAETGAGVPASPEL
jgi:hypothetical protein